MIKQYSARECMHVGPQSGEQRIETGFTQGGSRSQAILSICFQGLQAWRKSPLPVIGISFINLGSQKFVS